MAEHQMWIRRRIMPVVGVMSDPAENDSTARNQATGTYIADIVSYRGRSGRERIHRPPSPVVREASFARYEIRFTKNLLVKRCRDERSLMA